MKDSNKEKLFLFLKKLVEENIPFVRHMDLKVDLANIRKARIEFLNQQSLSGKNNINSLHGGAISTVLDISGGLLVMVELINEKKDKSITAVTNRLKKIRTIDIRVDYLNSGLGNKFISTASILRLGNRIAVTRMDLCDDDGTPIAAATGSYVVD